jgi:hypothetical protein
MAEPQERQNRAFEAFFVPHFEQKRSFAVIAN